MPLQVNLNENTLFFLIYSRRFDCAFFDVARGRNILNVCRAVQDGNGCADHNRSYVLNVVLKKLVEVEHSTEC